MFFATGELPSAFMLVLISMEYIALLNNALVILIFHVKFELKIKTYTISSLSTRSIVGHKGTVKIPINMAQVAHWLA